MENIVTKTVTKKNRAITLLKLAEEIRSNEIIVNTEYESTRLNYSDVNPFLPIFIKFKVNNREKQTSVSLYITYNENKPEKVDKLPNILQIYSNFNVKKYISEHLHIIDKITIKCGKSYIYLCEKEKLCYQGRNAENQIVYFEFLKNNISYSKIKQFVRCIIKTYYE